MLQLGIRLMWLVLYQYYIEQICDLEKGRGKRITVWGMTGTALLATEAVVRAGLVSGALAADLVILGGWLFTALVLFLYVVFYDRELLAQQWWKALAPGALLALCALKDGPVWAVLLNGAVLTFFLWMLSFAKGYFRMGNALVNSSVYGILCIYLWNIRNRAGTGQLLCFLALELLLFLSLEGTLSS